ncbi:Ppx/GppA phosphatase family protein [Solitalea koreensis]|uniref:Exopolyphosphatase / guanosine-5'-triphosphate,3'-diphosphate pyrophosphatase n=1 Tax=Solitalea koreensis TaxID=543615 RepID=A0A521BKN7_9SPHI|nr:exopolyphosphatase [Solitalea koreensis]SMO47646.1 exopolyphosphatase / guanosine-5'-triphosphate,3'-diphosphate pyrophosphatase [Solitalea koreensis]
MRYAAIDIGSNAVRLLIADMVEINEEISFKKNSLVRVPIRLGDDAFLDKYISERKANDLVKSMSAFRNLMDVYKVRDYTACATSAMREAQNGSDIVMRIKNEANIDLEIVDGKREANIIYSSHIEKHLDSRRVYLYIDVGGGSTEVSVFANGLLIDSNSFNIGTIRMLDNQDTEETWNELKSFIKTLTKNYKNIQGIGTGGNINKLFKISGEKEGVALTFAKLKALYDYLNSFSLKDRINVLGLKEDRADVIIPASEIYLTIMRWAGIKQMFVPKVGLVDGLIHLLIEKNYPKVVSISERTESL